METLACWLKSLDSLAKVKRFPLEVNNDVDIDAVSWPDGSALSGG